MEETGVPGENHRPMASNWQTFTHTVCAQSRHRTRAAAMWSRVIQGVMRATPQLTELPRPFPVEQHKTKHIMFKSMDDKAKNQIIKDAILFRQNMTNIFIM